MSKQRVRETYELSETRVPGVMMFGYDAIDAAEERGLFAHEHGNAYELCLILDGGVEWWVGDETFAVGPGELYLTKPHEIHGGVDSVLQPCELYWCIFELDEQAEFASLARLELEALAAGFSAIKRRTFPANAGVRQGFDQAFSALRQSGPLADMKLKNALMHVLLETLHCHEQVATQQKEVSSMIERAMGWIDAHLGETFSIDDVAAEVGLSVNRFHERFRHEVGYAPGDWRLRRRVDLAKHMLRSNDITITDVAMRGGFASSQYFATSFKRMVGLTPSEYRKRVAPINPCE